MREEVQPIWERAAEEIMRVRPPLWHERVAIYPVVKMDTPRGLWRGMCMHPAHMAEDPDNPMWFTAMGNAGGVAVALDQHWRARHGD